MPTPTIRLMSAMPAVMVRAAQPLARSDCAASRASHRPLNESTRIIPLANIAVGLEVAGALLTVVAELLDQRLLSTRT